MSKLRTYRVHFDICGRHYRDVQAFDEQDALSQVDGDMIGADDLENAQLENISVDDGDVELLKKRKSK